MIEEAENLEPEKLTIRLHELLQRSSETDIYEDLSDLVEAGAAVKGVVDIDGTQMTLAWAAISRHSDIDSARLLMSKGARLLTDEQEREFADPAVIENEWPVEVIVNAVSSTEWFVGDGVMGEEYDDELKQLFNEFLTLFRESHPSVVKNLCKHPSFLAAFAIVGDLERPNDIVIELAGLRADDPNMLAVYLQSGNAFTLCLKAVRAGATFPGCESDLARLVVKLHGPELAKELLEREAFTSLGAGALCEAINALPPERRVEGWDQILEIVRTAEAQRITDSLTSRPAKSRGPTL